MNPAEPDLRKEAVPTKPHWARDLIGVPLLIFGGVVTMFFGLFQGFNVMIRIAGGPPQAGWMGMMCFWAIFGAAPMFAGLSLVKANPIVRRVRTVVLLAMAVLFILLAADAEFGPNKYQSLFRRDAQPSQDASQLPQTVVTPVVQTPLVPGTNVLWCGTFQLVWNEACRLNGGNLTFTTNQPLVSLLNKREFTKDSIDDDSYVAMAGIVRDGIYQKLPKVVEQKFRGKFKARYLPKQPAASRPQDLVAYACLFKRLHFEFPFERQDEALTFSGTHVRAFGIGKFSARTADYYPQVVILDYKDENDFVIQLKTQPPGDQLLLAKVAPETNLEQTISTVLARIAHGTNEITSTNDILRVPRIHLDIEKQFDELLGLRLVPGTNTLARDLHVLTAFQATAFDVDEKGVELKSEAHMAMGCAKEEEPEHRHIMVFDRAFLVLLKRETAKTPYFALWLDNPELLVQWK